jgi:hypothetical protein
MAPAPPKQLQPHIGQPAQQKQGGSSQAFHEITSRKVSPKFPEKNQK